MPARLSPHPCWWTDVTVLVSDMHQLSTDQRIEVLNAIYEAAIAPASSPSPSPDRVLLRRRYRMIGTRAAAVQARVLGTVARATPVERRATVPDASDAHDECTWREAYEADGDRPVGRAGRGA